MRSLSRRQFGKAVMAGVPLASLLPSTMRFAVSDVVFGVCTSSFRDLPRITGRDNVDDVIRALHAVHATHIELSMSNVEPAPPSVAPAMGGSNSYPRRIVLSPEEVAATNAGARTSLRAWRLATGDDFFESVRARLAAAGITVHACSLSCNESFTDAEIDATFRQIKALGVETLSSAMTLATAKRLVPFAQRHRMRLAIHNQADGAAGGLVTTQNLGDALALSPAFALKLDVGNLTASNCDAVTELRTHQARVAFVVAKDRLRNGGASQIFGEGDTPLAGVVRVLQSAARPIPALVEYDYVGLRSPVDEVSASIGYLTRLTQ
jgi:hypothetical protein